MRSPERGAVVDVPADRLVVWVPNHDQTGNRARGELLAVLVSPDALRLAAAILPRSPYVPLLVMGEEHGETNPLLYFVRHGEPALVEPVLVRNDAAAEWAEVRYQREGGVLEGIFNLSSEARVGGSGEAAMGQGLRLPGHSAVMLRGAAS